MREYVAGLHIRVVPLAYIVAPIFTLLRVDYVIKFISKFYQLKPNFKEKVIILLQNISFIKLI